MNIIFQIRISKNSDLIPYIENAGYYIEPDIVAPDDTLIVEIPVAIEGIRTTKDVSMWEQLMLASFLQEYWSDNQVSCTITFKPEEGKEINQILNYFQYKLKAISFLPKVKNGVYPQMPYEEISDDVYNELIKPIQQINFNNISEDSKVELFCTNDTCEIIKK